MGRVPAQLEQGAVLLDFVLALHDSAVFLKKVRVESYGDTALERKLNWSPKWATNLGFNPVLVRGAGLALCAKA